MNLRRYLTDPYYWRRALLRVVEAVTRRTNLETHFDELMRDNWFLADPMQLHGNLAGDGMRLLYVAPKFDYGNPARGYSYEENHFLPALASLGFQLFRFDSLSLVRRFGKQTASQLLAEVAYRFKPQLAFFVLFKDDFEETAIEELTRQSCITLNWFTDDHWRFDAFSSRWAPKFSWAISTDPKTMEKYHAKGIRNVILSQWGVNHHLYRPLDRGRCYDVTFIGQPHGTRRSVIKQLVGAGIHVECWGYGWPRGKLSTRGMVKVINESAVNLNLSNAVTGTADQIKGRDFEVPAAHGLLLTGRSNALNDYFDIGVEILAYEDVEDMTEKIRWALEHPKEAEQIREAGYQRTLRDHTYEKRFIDILRKVGVFR